MNIGRASPAIIILVRIRLVSGSASNNRVRRSALGAIGIAVVLITRVEQ